MSVCVPLATRCVCGLLCLSTRASVITCESPCAALSACLRVSVSVNICGVCEIPCMSVSVCVHLLLFVETLSLFEDQCVSVSFYDCGLL